VTGISKNNGQLVAALRDHGVDVVVADNGPLTAPVALPYIVRRLLGIARALAVCVRTCAPGRRSRIRAVHITLDAGEGLAFTIPVVLLARWAAATVFVQHHSFAYLNKRSPVFAIIGRLLRPTDTQVVLCSAMQDAMIATYPVRSRLRVVSNLALLDLPTASPDRHERERIVVGHLSNLTVDKGLDKVVDIADECHRRGLPVDVVVAGPCADSQWAAELARRDADPARSFSWTRSIQGDERSAWYANCDVFLFPTTYVNEAQPNVAFEALASGAVVLATPRSCLAGDMAAFGLPTFSIADYAEAVMKLLEQWCADRTPLDEQRATLPGQAAAGRVRAERTLHDLLDELSGEHASWQA
jgi:glycosyltransferase involved in cell wall biosynthesis